MSRRRARDVVVVGGGVVGCAVAWSLARRGLDVALFERDEIAAHASGAAAGMLAPLVESEPDGVFRGWALRALDRFPALVAELRERSGVDPEWVRSGVLRVALDDAGAEALRRRGAAEASGGVALDWLDADEARAAAPGLAAGCRGGLWSPREGHVRSALLVRAYARAAAALGAGVEGGAGTTELVWDAGRRRVRGLRVAGEEVHAGQVVLCAGSWTPSALRAGGGVSLPIEPVRGQIVSLDAPSPAFGPIVWGGSTYLVPKRDGSVVVGATEERVGFECRVTAAGVAGLVHAALGLVPGLGASAFRSAWAGLRPTTPDRLPAIGPLPGVEGLLVAAGHHRNGVLLSPVTGELVADLVEGKGLPEDARPFLPARLLPQEGGRS